MKQKGEWQKVYRSKIVTDSGQVVRFGYEYGIIFDIDPLNGVDVELAKSQGFQQLGETVEGRSINGINREIRGKIVDNIEENKKLLLSSLSVFTKGKLYFGEDYYCDIVVKKTPYIVHPIGGAARFSMMVFCPFPFWLYKMPSEYMLGGYVAKFEFPTMLNEHYFGVEQESYFINCANGGNVAQPFSAKFSTRAQTVSNFGILNVKTGRKLTITEELPLGDIITLYQKEGRVYLTRTREGIEENIFYALDEDSDLFTLDAGDNLLRRFAESGETDLQISISFNTAFAGVVN